MAACCAQAQFLDSLDRPTSRINDIGLRWAVLEPNAKWDNAAATLRAIRADSPPWHTIALHGEARLPVANSTAVEFAADFALSESNPSRYIGLVFHHVDDDNYYLFRFNLPGNIQIVRYTEGKATVLLNENRRFFPENEFVRLRLRSDSSGVFLWYVDTHSGSSYGGRVTEASPAQGGLVGLYTTAPAVNGRPGAFFRHFLFTPDAARNLPSVSSRPSIVPTELLR